MIDLRRLSLLVFSICLLALFHTNACKAKGQHLPRFVILTEDWEPYQFVEEGEIRGIAVDLLVLILEELQSPQNRESIQMVPWARGYHLLQHQENTILFSTTRTLERENLFKWVGPIFQNTTYLVGKKSKNIRIQHPKDLQDFTIGTIIDDAGEQYMVKLGVPLNKLERNEKAVYNINKLARDRIDLVVCGWVAFVNDARTAGLDYNQYEPVYTVDRADVSYAFHKNTGDWVIYRFQNVLEDLKRKGVLKALFSKYKQQLPYQYE